MPNTIHYGGDSLHKIGDVSAPLGKKALIISDEIMDGLGYVEKCKELLAEHHIQSSVYLGVHSEPTDEFVDEALKQFQSDDCEFVISLGGGSCIDTAKAIAVLKTNPGDIGEFMGGKRLVEHEPTPHIAIPTTAGTGSEATDVTVITNTKTDVKMMIKQPAFMPTVAIVDPMLTMSVPKSVTAATGVDALSHAIEAYISKKAHPMTDAFAIAAMENILPNIKTAYDNGNNHEAREKMAIGSLQAGIAFSNASVCLVHGMSRPIGAMFHVPHGISNAMLLPAVLEYSQSDCVERLATIGKMFCDRGEKMTEEEYAILAVSKVKELCSYLDIPNLKGWGIEGDVFSEVLPKMAEDAINSGSPANNPKVSNQEEIIELYKRCFTYDFSESVINQ
ncbi:iron-containing alcohol dehydrogenase [Texcoconibacillus texcoconensis]|nr:iron-containing alcohol dehydrogenase [Texcoconibacillus texcoconensis]